MLAAGSGTIAAYASGGEDLLLSYRRDNSANAAGAAENAAPPAASNGVTAENPLRPAGTPPIQEPSVYQFGDATPSPTDNVVAPAPAPNANDAAPSPYADLATPAPTAPPAAPQSHQLPGTPLVREDSALQQAKLEEPAAPATPAETAPQEPTPASPLASADAKPLPLGEPLAPVPDESRRLAPRSPSFAAMAEQSPGASGSLRDRLPTSFSRFGSLSTAGAGLAIVVGLFFVCMWLLRRSSGAKPSGVLPTEAFAVLGRAPLTPQSFAQLLRVGNKLVLVAVSADGIQPLTEVIDPLEVDRLTGVCASGRGHGPAAEFQQVLAQLAREPARGFLGAEAANGGGRRRA
jgi:flagellar biogenesis protein FliO